MTIMLIIQAIANCFTVFLFMIFVRCLLTWFPNVNWENPILNALRVSTDAYLNLFRKIIPPIGPFDISPIIACFALSFIQYAVVYLAAIILSLLGMK